MPQDEGFPAADYASILKFSGDVARGISRAQHHEFLGRGLRGRQNGPGEPSCGGNQGYQEQPDELAHNKLSLAAYWMNPNLTMVIRLWNYSWHGLGARSGLP